MFGKDINPIIALRNVALFCFIYALPIADVVYYVIYYIEDKGKDTYHLQNMAISFIALLTIFLIWFVLMSTSFVQAGENMLLILYFVWVIFLLVHTIFKIIHYVNHWNWNHEDEKIRDSFRASFVLTCITAIVGFNLLFNGEED